MKCGHCHGAGCPKCMRTGYNAKLIASVVEEWGRTANLDYVLKPEMVTDLPVTDQRAIADFVKQGIALHRTKAK